VNLDICLLSMYTKRGDSLTGEFPPESGAIGFDWVIVDQGCVSWLISWPRKKLIKQ